MFYVLTCTFLILVRGYIYISGFLVPFINHDFIFVYMAKIESYFNLGIIDELRSWFLLYLPVRR